MISQTATASKIQPREHMDFQLDETIPKYWFRNDPFKTRLLDGMQMSFPEGERYFITCVRAFRAGISDPTLEQQVKDFIRQEGQHGLAHTKFNTLLAQQGMPVSQVIAFHKKQLERHLERFSPAFNLAMTAGFEHFTALMADAFFTDASVLAGADHRVKSLFAWHAIEEMEHKSVAFDVMQKVAGVGYARRTAAMAYSTLLTVRMMLGYCEALLKADGFGWWARKRMLLANLGWMYGVNGVFSALLPKILAYFKPGFHPTDIPDMRYYGQWIESFRRTEDPLKACDALVDAARAA
ncbi:metal-dependent hydrolase [Allohahella marinimesophila]|uniref:Metal-dependent hydrolase n=1 Tax=Allohahella marinimesophila TaxID=1054972 RepID=A0ABP7NHH9_9GAMM